MNYWNIKLTRYSGEITLINKVPTENLSKQIEWQNRSYDTTVLIEITPHHL